MSTSKRVLALLATFGPGVSVAQDFGRFGFVPVPPVAGLTILPEGLKQKRGGSQTLEWPVPQQGWRPQKLGALSASYFVKTATGGPDRVRVDLTAPGVALHFPKGIALTIRSIGAPYLSWTEGSVRENVPAPPAPFLVLSYADRQPSWVVGFGDDVPPMTLAGRPGAWVLQSAPEWKGWARFSPLVGRTLADPSNSAGSLGRLVKQAAALRPLWSPVAPALVTSALTEESDALIARFEFDRAGAIVPGWVTLAKYAKHPVKTTERVAATTLETEEGPVETTTTTTLTVRLPARAIPWGRPVGVGPAPTLPASVAAFDARGLIEAALAAFSSGSDSAARRMLVGARETFVSETPTLVEPWTRATVFSDAKGQNLDVVAANALVGLVTERMGGRPASPAPDALMATLGWRLDWATGTLGPEGDAFRRAEAFAAVAGAFAASPRDRYLGAVVAAGLAARRGRERIMARDRLAGLPEDRAPYARLRGELYGGLPQGPALAYLRSPVRYVGDGALTLDAESVARWTSEDGRPGGFVLYGPSPTFSPRLNLVDLKVVLSQTTWDVTYVPTAAGPVEAGVTFGSPLPAIAAPAFGS